MEFSLKEQFQGFLATPQIFPGNHIFDYFLYHAFLSAPAQQLPEITAPPDRVLGKRMEHFFACYITHFASEDVLAYNKQIIQNKKTIGELDFLLKDPASREISHVELVYKFYLYDPSTGSSELEHLIGPNKRDSLEQKLHRLQKRQFPLLFHEKTKELLDELGVDREQIVQKMCFKASVFLPKENSNQSFTKINPETISGTWIKASEFTSEKYNQNQFFIPKKKYWPVQAEKNTTWFTMEKIKPQLNSFLEKKYSPLLWMKTPLNRYERFFVVWW